MMRCYFVFGVANEDELLIYAAIERTHSRGSSLQRF